MRPVVLPVRAVCSTAIALTLSGLLMMPAGAITPEKGRSDEVPPVSIPTTLPEPGTVTEADPVRPAPVDPRPVDPRPEMEMLRLSCDSRVGDTGRHGIGCEWSATTRPDAAGYVVLRTSGGDREVVFRTSDLSKTSMIDSAIRIDVRYSYSVRVVDANGHIVGQGGPVQAGVSPPVEEPSFEVLSLACDEHRSDGTSHVVGCEWRPASTDKAVAYQLWRIVDRDGRELVWRGGLNTTTARDHVRADAKLAVYAVLALDSDGEIVGRSRPQTVRFTDHPGPDVPGVDSIDVQLMEAELLDFGPGGPLAAAVVAKPYLYRAHRYI